MTDPITCNECGMGVLLYEREGRDDEDWPYKLECQCTAIRTAVGTWWEDFPEDWA